uniref:Uncharacterized protein n=1 Tax=Sphaerodactylus townsendi TaxID=933632 RepID=A0ACB8G3K9_9SAUR
MGTTEGLMEEWPSIAPVLASVGTSASSPSHDSTDHDTILMGRTSTSECRDQLLALQGLTADLGIHWRKKQFSWDIEKVMSSLPPDKLDSYFPY